MKIDQFIKESKDLIGGNQLPRPFSFYEDICYKAFELVDQGGEMEQMLFENYVQFLEVVVKKVKKGSAQLFNSDILHEEVQSNLGFSRPEMVPKKSAKSEKHVKIVTPEEEKSHRSVSKTTKDHTKEKSPER